MNRRERRVWKRKTRRIGIALASVAALGASVGLSGIGGASQSWHSCDGNYYTAYLQHGANDFYPGQAEHACD
jgi:hypothetical protein